MKTPSNDASPPIKTRNRSRRALVVLAWLITIVVLFYAEENWRGRRAWNEYRLVVESEGEQLNLSALLPQPLPADQNFAANPEVQSWFEKKDQGSQPTSWNDRFEKVQAKVTSFRSSKPQRQLTDLAQWAEALTNSNANTSIPTGSLDRNARAQAAPIVLQAMADSTSALETLRQASSRPQSRYPINWEMENPWGIRLPHMMNIRAAGQRLQVKASAQLAAGHSDQAMEDVRLIVYLADSVKDEPILISYLVRLSTFQLAVQSVWDGLMEHRWTEDQLVTLQAQFSRSDWIPAMKLSLDGERAMGVMTPQLIKKKGLGLLMNLQDPNPGVTPPVATVLGMLMPSGWYHFEQRNYLQLYQRQLAGSVNWKTRQVFAEALKANAKLLEKEVGDGRLGKGVGSVLHHRLFAHLLLPALSKIPAKAAEAQTSANNVVLACALERYQIAHGHYPQALNDLTPNFVHETPHDVLTGDVYKYRLNDDGSFLLYSVGWDGKDDGGTSGKTIFDENGGDWVWQSASPVVKR